MGTHAETIRRVMEGDFQDATDEEKRAAARELITVSSVAAGAVSFQPFPLVDAALITPIQIAMVQGIGRIHGYTLDKKAVVEVLSTIGASIVAQNVIIAAAKLVPLFGWVVSISMAYALTYAIGEVSDQYYESGRGLSREEMRSHFDAIYKEKREETAKANRGNASLKDRLEQLNEARAADLLTDEEYAAKKEELLASF